jgi:beta-lactamase class D
MTERITAVAPLSNGWAVHGKAGTGSPARGDGTLEDDHSYGWFVGWAARGSRQIVFVYLIQDEKPEAVRAGLRARDAFLKRLPGYLDAITGF